MRKYLFIFLLLALPVMGQTKFEKIANEAKQLTDIQLKASQDSVTQIDAGFSYPITFKKDVGYVLLSWLQDYEKECWTDSTLHDRYNEGYHPNTVTYSITSKYDSTWEAPIDTMIATVWKGETIITLPRFYYQHRNVSMGGFIEFLKRKLGD